MRRPCRRDKQYAIQMALYTDFLRDDEVTGMDRIERPAENTKAFHGVHRSMALRILPGGETDDYSGRS